MDLSDAGTSDPLEALSLFAEATQDLVTAGLEQAIGRFFACADACNQCAEKALQSVFLAQHGHRAPYDHDLAALATTVGAPASAIADAAALTPFHPAAFHAHTDPEAADDAVAPEVAAECIARARRLQQWARTIIVM